MSGPTIRRRQLGRQLRQLRDAAGKSSRAAAEWLDVSQATVSKVENGKQAPKIAHVRLLLQLYGVESPRSEAILRLAREANQRGWWTAYGDTVPDWFRDYVGLETDATELWTYDAELIHGLLQTPDYIRAVTAACNEESADFDVECYIDQRQARQDRLTSSNPPLFSAVVSEGALRRMVGGPEVMRAQIQHLIELSKLPHVTLPGAAVRGGRAPGDGLAVHPARFRGGPGHGCGLPGEPPGRALPGASGRCPALRQHLRAGPESGFDAEENEGLSRYPGAVHVTPRERSAGGERLIPRRMAQVLP